MKKLFAKVLLIFVVIGVIAYFVNPEIRNSFQDFFFWLAYTIKGGTR
jgi:hypothetical protein